MNKPEINYLDETNCKNCHREIPIGEIVYLWDREVFCSARCQDIYEAEVNELPEE